MACMNLIDYLSKYKDKSLKEEPFNEVDALIFALMSYFPFELIKKKKLTSPVILEFLETYKTNDARQRKLLDIFVLRTLCSSRRYKGIKFAFFEKSSSHEAIEQFQAVCIEMKNFTYVSFAGTDSSTIGWREDFNMGYLDIVPSEIDAIQYINRVRKKHPFKKLYLGGHSKGGRLSIRAGKEIYKRNTVEAIFSFDGPNFPDSFYDQDYENIKALIHEYAPSESVIGRLLRDQSKIIIDSNAELFQQHDAYTWLVEDDHFVHLEKYTPRSDKITKIVNGVFTQFSNEEKSVFVNTLFDLLDKHNITEFKDDNINRKIVLSALTNLGKDLFKVSKETRQVILKIMFTILIAAIKK